MARRKKEILPRRLCGREVIDRLRHFAKPGKVVHVNLIHTKGELSMTLDPEYRLMDAHIQSWGEYYGEKFYITAVELL